MALPLHEKTRRETDDMHPPMTEHGSLRMETAMAYPTPPLRHQRLLRRKRGTERCSRHRWPQADDDLPTCPAPGATLRWKTTLYPPENPASEHLVMIAEASLARTGGP